MNTTQRKLSVAKRPGTNRLVHAWIGDNTSNDLARAKRTYATILDRPVSHSLVIRRALRLLSDHLGVLDTPAQVEAEVAALMRSAR